MAAKTTRRSSGTIHFAPEVTFAGNTATISSTDLSIGDSLLTLNKGNSSLPSSSGIELEEAGSIVAGIKYAKSGTKGIWTFTGQGSAEVDFQNVTATNLTVSSMTNLTVTNLISNNVDIGGGDIDSTPIGATSHSTGKFTNLTATGTVNLGSGSVSATTFTGALTGDVTGNSAGVHTGNLIGDVYASDTTTKILEAGTNGSDATIQATLTGNSTGIHTGNVRKGDGTVIVDVAATPASFTGQVSSIANHSTTNLSEGTNLYYTNARADARIAAASINDLTDVNTSGINTNNILQWNGTAFVPTTIGYSVANWQTATHTTNGTITGASLAAGAASGLSDSITVVGSTKVRVEAQSRYKITGSGNCDFYAQLKRTSGTPAVLAEEKYSVTATTAQTINSNFDIFETVSAGTHTYAIEFFASANTISLETNPAQTSGTATSYIQLTEQIVNASIMQNVVEDSSPQLGGDLDAQSTRKVINLAAPTNPNDAATKTYVDSQILTKDTLGELTDVTISGASNGQVLKYNGSAWVNGTDEDNLANNNTDNLAEGSSNLYFTNARADARITAVGFNNVVEDTTPQLGGALDVNGKDITGTSVSITTSANGDINLTPHGTGKVNITGDLNVDGDTTTIDVQTLEVEDPIIILNKHESQPTTNSTDTGLIAQRGSTENNAAWFWDETSDRWIAATTTSDGSATNITVTANANMQAGTAYLTATEAQYADLAELYTSDSEYPAGTIVVHGGDKEVTQSTTKMDHRVAGVVSSKPAYLMNSEEKGTAIPVALRGKVPVSIIGPVAKGDLIVTSDTPGVGEAHPGVTNCVFVIGKALEDDDTENLVRLINVLV